MKWIILLLLALMVSCGGDPSTDGLVIVGGDHPYLTWDANLETDLAGYIVHWGPEPGVYQRSLDVGLDRVVYLKQLALWLGWNYFAVTAYDTSGNESDYSNEVSWNNAN